MKKILSILAILLILSCNNSNTSKEKFQYERVKEDNVSTQSNSVSNNVILNSNDQMKFDKRIIRVNANESVTLTLNHTGRFPAISMGHNFVLIKKDIDVDDYAIDSLNTFPGSSPTLVIFGNSWKSIPVSYTHLRAHETV